MISFESFFDCYRDSPLGSEEETLRALLQKRYYKKNHGDLPAWQACLDTLPDLQTSAMSLDTDTLSVGSPADISTAQHETLLHALEGLHPWRKGPFNFFGIQIDTEWRSDWKWNRIAPHIEPLHGRTVLDVGCGSGYHCWRMRGAGARRVLGIDTSLKFLYQFEAFRRYLPEQQNVHYLPIACENLPSNLRMFDTVFSMGVLYHRRSPFDHIEELKQALRPGGQLVLETLVVPGDEHTVLCPIDRYAQMRNVWMIPSVHALKGWLLKMGFTDVCVADINTTTSDEQRRTPWMRFLSLRDFLSPEDPTRTIEGHPAPTRATLIAHKPF